MKKLFTILATVLLTASVFLPRQVNAQSPEKMSYQAVIRDASDNLVTDTQVGMQISILQGSASGTAVYVETQDPTTNANGLVSIEIGTGATSDDFSAIDWANGPYFIKTETDPTGGTTYTITGTNQLLSVPYAMHAKTADTVTGGITESDPVFGAWDKSTGISITESQISDLDHFTNADETDPVFDASVASGITGTDTTNWNNKLDSESDPVFGAWDKSTGISITESQISDLDHFTNADETDPVFDASVASGITGTDTTNWNNKLDSETDPVFGAWDKSTGISITESQISDLDHFTTADETDPAVADNFDFTGAASGDLLQFDGSKFIKFTPDYISDYTVTEGDVTAHQGALQITESQITDLQSYLTSENDPVFGAWDKSTGISITESQISDLDHFTNADETDPVFGSSVASGISGTDTTNWNNESDPLFSDWDKSTGISITESQISDLDHFTNADETDPVYGSSVASGITGIDTTNWNNKLDSETDPVFGAWDKSTGISITESQISDLDHFSNADETDPVFGASVASGVTATDTTNWNNKLDTETDPVFGAWDKSTGISITESQISDLDHFTNADETDPVFTAWDKDYADLINTPDLSDTVNYLTDETDPSVPTGTQTGEMQYWDGSEWVTVAPTENDSATLQMIGGVPTWTGGTPPQIGDYRDGGVVFYVAPSPTDLNGDGSPDIGLVCAVSDQSTGAEWGCYGDGISGADGTTIGTGAQNTIDIENGCATSGIAADICANLSLNGYNDWFLPSKDELNEMYQNKATIDATATSNGGSGFASAYYWSSTEYSDFNAWIQTFDDGLQGLNDKIGTFYVRAVRAF